MFSSERIRPLKSWRTSPGGRSFPPSRPQCLRRGFQTSNTIPGAEVAARSPCSIQLPVRSGCPFFAYFSARESRHAPGSHAGCAVRRKGTPSVLLAGGIFHIQRRCGAVVLNTQRGASLAGEAGAFCKEARHDAARRFLKAKNRTEETICQHQEKRRKTEHEHHVQKGHPGAA